MRMTKGRLYNLIHRKPWKPRSWAVLCLLVLLVSGANVYAIMIDPLEYNPDNPGEAFNVSSFVEQMLEGTGIDITSASLTLSIDQIDIGATRAGTFTNDSGTYAIGDGIVMSTGDVRSYEDGTNTSSACCNGIDDPHFNGDFGGMASVDQELLLDPITGGDVEDFDVVQLDIAFDMQAGFDTVYFAMVFGSEEYFPEDGQSFVNDGFGAFLNGVNIALLSIGTTEAFAADIPGTELDGVYAPWGDPFLVFSSALFPSALYEMGNVLTFIMADASDSVFDTTVYISGLGGVQPSKVPEPASLLLVGSGLAFLISIRKKFKGRV